MDSRSGRGGSVHHARRPDMGVHVGFPIEGLVTMRTVEWPLSCVGEEVPLQPRPGSEHFPTEATTISSRQIWPV